MTTKIRKSKVAKPTVKSVLAQFEAYKQNAITTINKLIYPNTQGAFTITSYEKTATGVKPNAISAPELAAITGTAQKLGKTVQVKLNGTGEGATLGFYFVDTPSPTIPSDLLYY